MKDSQLRNSIISQREKSISDFNYYFITSTIPSSLFV